LRVGVLFLDKDLVLPHVEVAIGTRCNCHIFEEDDAVEYYGDVCGVLLGLVEEIFGRAHHVFLTI
jgi:hypothetical protein